MRHGVLWMAAVLALASVLQGVLQQAPLAAALKDVAATAGQRAAQEGDGGAGEQPVVTRHELVVEGNRLQYKATAGKMAVPRGEAEGEVFYVAYQLEGDTDPRRPVTFAFNGGPGASAVWLHMGALGPARVDLGASGELPHPPVGYVPNPDTWLRFTDLVFVDPVGTGFSRSREEQSGASGDTKQPKDNQDKQFWGVEQDVEYMADFIRMYLSRNERWQSPLFLVGESYGTTRAAALSMELLESEGVALSGLVLVSPVLDFNTLMAGESNLPYGLFLPSYAATARLHGKGFEGEQELHKALRDVEEYVGRDYLPALFLGDALESGARKELYSRVHSLTGMPEDIVRRHFGRIPASVFFKHLLQDERLLVGRMDGSATAVDPEPWSAYPSFDPSLEGVLPAFASSFNAYVRQDLGYQSDLPYEILNPEVERNWDWSSGLQGRMGYVITSDDVRKAMSMNPRMHVWLVTGYYDLATPYFASLYTVRQMELAPSLRENLRFDVYHGGHMLYTHARAREALVKDAADFYDSATK